MPAGVREAAGVVDGGEAAGLEAVGLVALAPRVGRGMGAEGSG